MGNGWGENVDPLAWQIHLILLEDRYKDPLPITELAERLAALARGFIDQEKRTADSLSDSEQWDETD